MMNRQTLLDQTPWAFLGFPDDRESLNLALSHPLSAVDSQHPFFTLITPMWNTPSHFLEAAIHSCLLQTFSNWELILIDDGSSQVEHLDVATRLSAQDSRIRFYKSVRNGGISHARNEAITKARGEYIAILDHDDLLHPFVLSHFYENLLKNPVDLIYCNEVKIDTDGRRLADFFFKPGFDRQTLLRSNYIAHLAAVKATRVHELQTNDGFCFDSQFDGVEDHQYFLRLSALSNFTITHTPIFGYYWRKSPTSTAEAVSAKPYVKPRLCKMLANYGLKNSTVSWPIEHKIPVWIYSVEAPIDCKLLIWGPADKDFIGELRQQKSINFTQIIVVSNATFPPQPGSNFKFKPDATEFTVVVHSSLRFESTDALSQLVGFLRVDASYSSCSPKIIDETGLDRGDFSLHWAKNQLTQTPILQSWNLESDFSSEQRLGVLPSPFCSVLRQGRGHTPLSYQDLWREIFDSERFNRPFYLGNVAASVTTNRCIPDKLSLFSLTDKPNRLASILTHHQMSYDSHMRWLHASPIIGDWLDVPFRYKVVDRVNTRLKSSLKPLHKFVKVFLKKTHEPAPAQIK